MRSLVATGAAISLLVVGCRLKPPNAPETPRRPYMIESDPQGLLKRISELRGLKERRPTRIVFHHDAEFRAALEVKGQKDGIGPTIADALPFQTVFGFIRPAPTGDAPPTLAAVQRNEVIAFYDQFDHVVHVRQRSDYGEGNPDYIVAHEMGHALQHQWFRVPEIREIHDEDKRLAQLALLEGDAMLVMMAFMADDNHVPLNRALVRASETIERGAYDEYKQVLGSESALKKTPPAVRQRLIFPYLGGVSFVGALYRAGGYELLNRAYDIPPTTTEQILHPERYLAGEGAVPVRTPESPEDYEPIGDGQLGELQTRVLLGTCNPPDVAARAAAGWGGDAFLIARKGETGGLLWSTTWDSELDADEFDRAMQNVARCWSSGSNFERALMPGKVKVKRRGLNVAVVRGLPSSETEASTHELLGLPEQRTELRAPFGPINIPMPRRPGSPRRPFVDAGRVIDERLGLLIPLPPAYAPKLGEGIVLTRQTELPATLAIAASDLLFRPTTNELILSEAGASLERALDLGRLEVESPLETLPTPLGSGVARVWRLDKSALRLRVTLLPVCRNTGSIVLHEVWGTPEQRTELDWIIQHLRPLVKVPPVCAELDP